MPLEKIGHLNAGMKHEVLDVVTNGQGVFVCVRANNEDEIKHTQYWMALAKGDPGPAGSKLDISDDGYWIKDGVKTNHKAQGPQGSAATTQAITSGQDLNSLTTNGPYYADHVATTHSPFNDSSRLSYMLTVSAYRQSVVQEAFDLSTASKWVRTNNGSQWTAWRELTQWN